jgi:hypothetical protein
VRFLATFTLFSALLLAGSLRAGTPDRYQVRVFPRMSMPGAELTLTIEDVGPLTEATYCLGVEVWWPAGAAHSRYEPDCPPWEEYIRQQAHAAWCEDLVIVCPPGLECFLPSCREPVYQLERRWTFSSRRVRVGYGPGEYKVEVEFLLPNRKTIRRSAPFMIGGMAE